MEMYQPTVPMIRRVKLAWMNFRMWPGFKWIVRSLVALVILSLLGWGGFMMTPGKRSERLIAHAQEKITEKAWDEAVVAMRKATGIYSNDRPTRWMLANTLFGARKVQEGIAEMEHALMMPPFEEDSYEQLFQTYYNIMRTSAATEQILNQVTKLRETLPSEQQWMPTLLMARVHFTNSKFDESITLFNQLLKDGHQSRRINIDFAQSLFAADKVESARKIYQNILETSPNDAEASHGLATALASQGKVDDALSSYIRASLTSANPQLGTLLNGALFALNLGQLREAKNHFIDQLAMHYPDTRESILMQMQYDVLAGEETHFFQILKDKIPDINEVDFSGLMDWCITRGQPLWSLELLKNHKPLEMGTETTQSLYAAAWIKMRRFGDAQQAIEKIPSKERQQLLMAEIDIETRRFEEANKKLEQLAALKNQKTSAISELAKQKLDKIKNFQEALIRTDLLSRSRFLLAQGKADDVLQLHKDSKNLNVEIQLTGVLAMLQLGQDKKAARQLEALIQQYPDNESIWILWGRLISASDPEKALRGIKRIAASNTAGPGIKSLLGEIQYQLGQHKNAISTWKEVSFRWPNTTIGTIDNVLIGQAYMAQSNWASAIKVWEKVLKRAPSDVITLNNLAYCLLKTGKDYDRAKRLAEQALLILPERPEIIDTLEQINKAISSPAKKASKPKGSAKASAP